MICLTATKVQQLEKIYQTAHELPNDGTVHSHLTPNQAKQLRDWGLETLQACTIQTLHLSGSQAQNVLREKAAAVYAIMQCTNQLMGLLGYPHDQTDIVPHQISDDSTIRLLKNLRWLTGQVCPPKQLMILKNFHQQRLHLDQNAAFHLLITLLSSVCR